MKGAAGAAHTGRTKTMFWQANAERSYAELDHVLRIEELFLMQRVAQKINSILDLEPLLDQVVADVAKTFGYSRLALLLKDDDTNELVIAAGWTGERCMKGTRFKIGQQEGISGHAASTGETFYASDVKKNPFYIAGEEDSRSELDIPLKVRDSVIGIFNFQETKTDAFTPERIRLLEALAGHISTGIENARLFQRERLEKERMAKELEEARSIQSRLFPRSFPKVEGFDIDGICMPCREVGGDWYDFIPLQGGRVGIVVADVCGKGIAAAFLMSSARSVLRLYAARELSPGEVLSEVNSVLLNDFPSARFATAVYAIVDSSSRTISFANAGHLHPLFIDPYGARFLESQAGLPLGLMECTFPEVRIKPEPGSRLVLYTDGVTESVNSSLEEYGQIRLRDHFLQKTATAQTLLGDLRDFTSGRPFADDVTIAAITATPFT